MYFYERLWFVVVLGNAYLYRLDSRTVNALASCAGGQECESQRPAKSYTRNVASGLLSLQHLRK